MDRIDGPEAWLMITCALILAAYALALLHRRFKRRGRPVEWDALAIRKRNIARSGYNSRMGSR